MEWSFEFYSIPPWPSFTEYVEKEAVRLRARGMADGEVAQRISGVCVMSIYSLHLMQLSLFDETWAMTVVFANALGEKYDAYVDESDGSAANLMVSLPLVEMERVVVECGQAIVGLYASGFEEAFRESRLMITLPFVFERSGVVDQSHYRIHKFVSSFNLN